MALQSGENCTLVKGFRSALKFAPSELKTLRVLVGGNAQTIEDVAEIRGLSVSRVNQQIAAMKRKSNAANRMHLVFMAVQEGLLDD